MATWDKNAFGIDVSRWQTSLALKAGDVDFVIAKMGGAESYGLPYEDKLWAAHVDNAYKAGAVVMGYWFLSPRYYLEHQWTLSGMKGSTDDADPIVKQILASVKNKAIKAFWFDIEDASDVQGNGPCGDVWITEHLEHLRERIVANKLAGNFPKIPLGVYSRSSFIYSNTSSGSPRFPGLQVWLEQHPEVMVWTANYRSMPGGVHPLATIKTNARPADTTRPMPFGFNPQKPRAKEWHCWQYYGSAAGLKPYQAPEVAGGASALDLNLWNGDIAALKADLGIVDTNPPPPPVEPPTTGDTAARLAEIERILKFHNLRGV